MSKPRVIKVSHQPKLLAHVEAKPAEPGMSYETYRAKEDERMVREIAEQIAAMADLASGVTVH